MPGYQGHLLGACVAFVFTATMVPGVHSASPFMLFQWLGCTLLGSLFPDIDTKSKGQKLFYQFLTTFLLYEFLYENYKLCALCALIAMAPLLVRHRGVFHNPWIIMAITGGPVAYAVSIGYAYAYEIAWYALFFGAGAISHLFLDIGVKGFLGRLFFVKRYRK